MHKKKHGTLKSGGSGATVKTREQAIAIGLSEARKKGAKVPRASKRKYGRPDPFDGAGKQGGSRVQASHWNLSVSRERGARE
jgi:hypothetical protein